MKKRHVAPALILCLFFLGLLTHVSRSIFQDASSSDDSHENGSSDPSLKIGGDAGSGKDRNDRGSVGNRRGESDWSGRSGRRGSRDGDELADLVRITGRVVMLDSETPVAGARVLILAFSSANKPRIDQSVSDENGEFQFVDDFRGDYLIYAAREPLLSYETRRDITQIYVREADTEVGPLRLEMRRAQELALKVIDAVTEESIQGVRIKARGQLNLNFTTNERGIARIPLAPGIWSLEARAGGYIPTSMAMSLTGHQPMVTMSMQPAGTVFGKITDTEGKPLGDAEVTCQSGDDELVGTTNELGEYLIDQLPVDRDFTVSVSAGGHKPKIIYWVAFPPNSSEKELDIALEKEPDPEDVPYLNVQGTVRDENGSAIGGAMVYSGNKGANSYAQTFTTGAGDYVLAVPVVGRKRLLTAVAKGFAPVSGAYSPEEDPAVLDFFLKPGYSLSCVVTDTYGGPLDKVSVSGFAYIDQGDRYPGLGTLPLFDGEKRYTDEQGRFQLDSLPNMVHLSFSAWGYVPQSVGYDLEKQSEIVVKLAGLGALRGRVVDDKNRPVTQFVLSVEKEKKGRGLSLDRVWEREGIHFWSPDGNFSVDRLPPDVPLQITVSAEGYPQRKVSMTASSNPNAEPVTIVLEDTGISIGGMLVDVDGRPRPNLNVKMLVYDGNDPLNARFNWLTYFRGTWRRNTMGVHETTTDAKGYFQFNGLPEGANLDLLVDREDLALTHKARIQNLTAVQLDNWVVTVAEGAVLNGSLDPDAAPGDKRIYVEGIEGTNFYRPFTLDGNKENFVVDRLPPGSYKLEIMDAHSRKIVQEKLILTQGQVLYLDL